ncbi:ParB/RepB/Spo0J family partition protein [Deinococcus sp. UR1]|uniref:ParB/RepB/Spo0J family partition protein n=1 Tax=Deinococcus sp. UR1 TaxID=1704277 RepID=UPI0006DC4496|nr:ParB N-terminal domain-containing protein [Deinococcus sp. UR1]PIG98316.1 hypothetical protein AMD26_009275 [Deinococcus sp. UR1]
MPTDAPPPLLNVTVPTPFSTAVPLDDLTEDTHGASNHLKGALRCTGQLQPIVLESLPSGEYRIRDGNRRVAAARSLGWTHVQADVYTGLIEAQWALVVAGVHNRSANPVEEARLYGTLTQTLTEAGIAANTGVPVQVIRARLSLLNLPGDVLDLIGTRTLSLSVAERTAKLRGVHAERAVHEIRAAAQDGKAFTATHLKAVTVARANALGSRLMAAAPPPPTLLPPETILAEEVRALCERRGVSVQALTQALTGSVPPVTPVQAAHVHRAVVH